MPHRRIETPRALIYVPDAAGPHPVLCFLHGKGEHAANVNDGEPFERLHLHGSPPRQARGGNAFIGRFIVVSPQLDAEGYWTSDRAGWVNEIVDEAIRLHGGDARRQILTGFSRGGAGAFLLAAASPRRWSAIWAVDPATYKELPPALPPDVRIWVDHGHADPGIDYREGLRDRFGLVRNQDGPRVIRNLGVGPVLKWVKDDEQVKKAWVAEHTRTCREAYETASMYDWILR